MRIRRATHRMNIIALDERVITANVYAIGTVVNVVAKKRSLPGDALSSGTFVVDLTILNGRACNTGLDENDGVARIRNLAVFQRHVGRIDDHGSLDIKPFNDRSGCRNDQIA